MEKKIKVEGAANKESVNLPSITVRLPKEFNKWFETYLDENGYTTPAELVRELLRERKQKDETQKRRAG